ncbi:MAG TPA: protease modulator HflC [Planctomycetaceae bacterium]|nr:protease modulator HflC [Planctomycetaceae bacterium]
MTQKLMQNIVRGLAGIGVLLLLAQFVVFTIDQRELGVVLRFGEPVRACNEPGLYFKVPLVESVRKFPRTLQFWGDQESEVVPDLPTKDNKKIEIIPWAVWRINDPIAFVQRMRTMSNAENRVAQFARGAIRDVITTYDLEDLVRSTDREMKLAILDIGEEQLKKLQAEAGVAEVDSTKTVKQNVAGRSVILDKINAIASRSLATGGSEVEGDAKQVNRGIELVEVGISHIDFVEAVRRRTFDRWKTEREAISTLIVKEGEEKKNEILNKTNAEIEEIKGNGQKQASEIRGNADALVIKRYADAISEVGEFYTFVRTLEAYEKSISGDTELIFTTDNDFLQTLQQPKAGFEAPE